MEEGTEDSAHRRVVAKDEWGSTRRDGNSRGANE